MVLTIKAKRDPDNKGKWRVEITNKGRMISVPVRALTPERAKWLAPIICCACESAVQEFKVEVYELDFRCNEGP